MRKLVLSGAAIAALSVGSASAADITVRPLYRAPAPQAATIIPIFPTFQRGPIGVAGARWGNLCWVDVDATRYYGYWQPCAATFVAARVIRTRGVPIVARY